MQRVLELLTIVIAFILGITTSSCIGSTSPAGTYSVYNETYIIKSDGTAIVTKSGETYNTYWEYLSGGGDIRIREDRKNSWTLGWDYIDFDDKKMYWDYGDYRSHDNGVTYTKIN